MFKLGTEKGELDQTDQVVTVLPGLLLAEMLLANLFTFQHCSSVPSPSSTVVSFHYIQHCSDAT